MRTQRLACLLAAAFAVLMAAQVAETAEPGFVVRPTATRDGATVAVRFSVSAPTDVTVLIEDSRGKTVRHLVSGMLGTGAPPPLKPDSLEQSVVWDGSDDLGRPAKGGPFKAKVAVGLRPAQGRVIGNNPADLGGVRGLAVGPDGRLYVLHCYGGQHPNDGTTACAVFDRQGNYLRTILPFAADMPDEKLAGIRRVTREDGRKVPFVYQLETRSFLPGLGDLPTQRAVVSSDGRLGFVGVQEGPRPFAQPGEARLTVVRTDGAVAPDGVLKTLIHPLTDTGASLALAPDEKTLYATGVRAGTHPNGPFHLFACDVCDHGGATWEHTIPTPYVYRLGWNDPQAEVFVGGQRSEEARENRLVEPVSVATDGEGHVYVADVAANQVVVFSTDERGAAKLLRRVAIHKPQRVEVHRRTGAIYVLCGPLNLARAAATRPDDRVSPEGDMVLVKLDGWQNARELARIRLSRSREFPPTRRPIIALDDRADPAIVWVGQPLLRIEDRGNSFAEPVDLRDPARVGERALAAIMEMSIDRVHGWLYVNNSRRMNLATGQWESFRTAGGGMWPASNPGSANGNAGRDGNYYVDTGARKARVYRYGPDLKPIPFPKSNDPEQEGQIAGYSRNRGVGLTADAFGNVYCIWKKGAEQSTPDDTHRAAALASYNPDGSIRKDLLIDCQMPSLYSPRVDNAGNIYVVAGLRPGAKMVVPGLEGQVPESPRDPDAVHGVNSYPLIYGSVVKFPPTGGVIRQGAGGVACNYGPGLPVEVKGARWIVPGVSLAGSLAAPKRSPGTIITCVCEFPNMDVDEFGRTFFPDAARCRVGVIDPAGNMIGWFGTYGNPDSVGSGTDIPLWWPQAVAVDDTTAYVGDRLNRRIVAVKLTYAAEAECQLP